jgi:hypothetical protein
VGFEGATATPLDSVGSPFDACAAGDNPEVDDPLLACSNPVVNAAEDDFCCAF